MQEKHNTKNQIFHVAFDNLGKKSDHVSGFGSESTLLFGIVLKALSCDSQSTYLRESPHPEDTTISAKNKKEPRKKNKTVNRWCVDELS